MTIWIHHAHTSIETVVEPYLHMRHLAIATRGGRRTLATAATPCSRPSIHHINDLTVEKFREEAFRPAVPCVFRKGHFASLPAASKWFHRQRKSENASPCLNTSYLSPYGAVAIPLEFTTYRAGSSTESSAPQVVSFDRFEAPLAKFLEQAHSHSAGAPEKQYLAEWAQMYLAQCPLASLPPAMQADLPTPEIVLRAGKGDVYDSSIWIGAAPTYTPLHRDPNPNLFVQLVGRKIFRLCEPAVGRAIFDEVQREIGRNDFSATMRGEEMMQGDERTLLERIIWRDEEAPASITTAVAEAVLDDGDGLFIPKGWWHSVKGVGSGIIGSANWWFR